MAGVLVVAEVRDGQLFSGSLAAVTLAQQIVERKGGHYDILVIGGSVQNAAADAATYGARTVLMESGEAFAGYTAAAYAASVVAAARKVGADFVLSTSTTFGKDLLPRVAARLGAGMLSDVMAITGEDGGSLVFKRPMFAGNVLTHVVCRSPIAVLSVRGTDFDKPGKANATSAIEPFSSGYVAGTVPMQVVGMEKTESARPDLTEARVVVAGGRGLKDGPNFYQVMEPLADALGAAIGASRAAVDSGFCPNDLQVGQTGKVVAPDLYIGVAISGAIQHLAGMKASKTIVTINKDQEAPLFAISDYGLVGDAFKLVPELVQRLKG